MHIGVMVGGSGVDPVVSAVRAAADAGLRRCWLPQVFSGEALTVIAVAGREIPDIDFGTAVIPTYPRHPLVLAQQALTTSAALGGGRLHLGIGLSHQIVIEGMLGMDGTLTWMAAPRIVGDRIAPSITAAAEAAGRPRPRVGVGLPVAVTTDVDAVLERAAASYAVYGTLPSYKRLLDEAGLDGPAGVVIAGDEDEVAARIGALADVGATEFLASPIGSRAVREETLRLLGTLSREAAVS